MRKFIRSGLVKGYVSFEVKRTEAYRAARRQQKTASNKHFYVHDVWGNRLEKVIEVPDYKWLEAKLEGVGTSVSNSSVKGNVRRFTPRSHWTCSGRREWLNAEPIMERAQRLNYLCFHELLFDGNEITEIIEVVGE